MRSNISRYGRGCALSLCSRGVISVPAFSCSDSGGRLFFLRFAPSPFRPASSNILGKSITHFYFPNSTIPHVFDVLKKSNFEPRSVIYRSIYKSTLFVNKNVSNHSLKIMKNQSIFLHKSIQKIRLG